MSNSRDMIGDKHTHTHTHTQTDRHGNHNTSLLYRGRIINYSVLSDSLLRLQAVADNETESVHDRVVVVYST